MHPCIYALALDADREWRLPVEMRVRLKGVTTTSRTSQQRSDTATRGSDWRTDADAESAGDLGEAFGLPTTRAVEQKRIA